MSNGTPPPASRGMDEAALRFILAYKFVKGLVLVAAGLLLSGALLFGLGGRFQHHVLELQTHATRAWALHVGELLAKFSTPKWLHWGSVALELDGTLNLVEAWALEKRHPWGPWLVVGVTALFLPVEAWELWHRPRLSRLALLVGNLCILVFLSWYARRHARQLASAQAPGTGAQSEARSTSGPSSETSTPDA
jgi:uncharacterized membrane protein (DUF2068 family)